MVSQVSGIGYRVSGFRFQVSGCCEISVGSEPRKKRNTRKLYGGFVFRVVGVFRGSIDDGGSWFEHYCGQTCLAKKGGLCRRSRDSNCRVFGTVD
jgi:hypothetical protein